MSATSGIVIGASQAAAVSGSTRSPVRRVSTGHAFTRLAHYFFGEEGFVVFSEAVGNVLRAGEGVPYVFGL